MNKSSFIKYFSENRNTLESFYPTEQFIIKKVIRDSFRILDVGCACAGLYGALKNHYSNIEYTGIEINKEAVIFAAEKYPEINLINTDFNNYTDKNNDKFDCVFSLSCFDWNVGETNDLNKSFYEMLNNSWDLVENGGYLILSLRIDEFETIFDSKTSYQFINYEGVKEGEIANYGILSIEDCSNLMSKLRPQTIIANGFLGKPSKVAITPKKDLYFVVFALQKSIHNNSNNTIFDLDVSTKFKDTFIKYYNKIK
jgi:SAM-dependent methyltransferase